MQFIIYTDGGCKGNRRDANCPGGYGYVMLDPSESVLGEGGGKVMDTTNNQMELLAVIKGLISLQVELNDNYGGAKNNSCMVITDSKYVCDNFDYLPEWKARGWRKKKKGTILNQPLWKQLDKLIPEFNHVEFSWVAGHSGVRYNERADTIVQEYMNGNVKPILAVKE